MVALVDAGLGQVTAVPVGNDAANLTVVDEDDGRARRRPLRVGQPAVDAGCRAIAVDPTLQPAHAAAREAVEDAP
jgi:hypothetical protein